MQATVERLRRLIDQVPSQLRAIAETASEVRPGPGKWSKKEVLGHLIDSASNNHQRFVRAQLTQPLSFPGYTQTRWVEVQAYQEASWEMLIQFWISFNTHLAHLISRIPEDKWNNLCGIDNGEPVTLAFLVRDYVRHLEHHLQQLVHE